MSVLLERQSGLTCRRVPDFPHLISGAVQKLCLPCNGASFLFAPFFFLLRAVGGGGNGFGEFFYFQQMPELEGGVCEHAASDRTC